MGNSKGSFKVKNPIKIQKNYRKKQNILEIKIIDHHKP